MKSQLVYSSLVLLLALALCSTASSQTTTSNLPTNGKTIGGRIVFKEVTIGAGLAGVNLTGNTHTGGVAWVDFDGDLFPDLFVTNGSGTQHYLFRNQGNGMFLDVSGLVPKPDIMLEDAGVKYADVDNDGDEDIFIPVDNASTVVPAQPVNPPDGGPNLFYRNQGDGTFIEEAFSAGLVHPLDRRTISAGFADWDRDGFVDLFQGSWTMYGLPLGVHDDDNRLYRNDGTGSFVDVTAAFGMEGGGFDCLTSIWVDIDNDRYPDLYVGNTAHIDAPPLFVIQDSFHRNSGGLSFSDDFATPRALGGDAYAPMGMDIADIDNDGDWDIYFTDNFANAPVPLGNVLYLGDGAGGLEESSADVAGIQADDSWPCGFADFDLDGWIDLWVGTTSPATDEFVYANRGNGTFNQVLNAGITGNTAKGGALADFDGDGDMDIVIWESGPSVRLYRNESLRVGNFLQIKLYGTTSNRGAIGAVVKVTVGGVTQMRRVSGGDSAHSQSEAILNFGVGNASSVQVAVEWPSGTDQVFPSVGVNDLILVDEDAGMLGPNVDDDGSDLDVSSGMLHVQVRSNFGARTTLTAAGFGPLHFDSKLRAHVGDFKVQTGFSLNQLVIGDERGLSWTPINER